MSDEIKQEYLLTEPEDIYGALRKLVLMGSRVKVKISGTSESFTSLITNADFKTRSFFMDRIEPLEGNDLIRAGNRFSIECDSQGIRVEFRMTGRLMYQPQKGLYRAEFPDEVLYLQRRTAYRVMIPPAHHIDLKLVMNDLEGDLTGQLIDISSSGFKAKFTGNVKKRLEEQGRFSMAMLRFNRQHNMECSLEARHALLTPNGDTTCGFSFLAISSMAQRYLDRLITELQWEERIQKENKEAIQEAKRAAEAAALVADTKAPSDDS